MREVRVVRVVRVVAVATCLLVSLAGCTNAPSSAMPSTAATAQTSPPATGAPLPTPAVTAGSSVTVEGVTVLDITLGVEPQAQAYLVFPEVSAARSAAGIVWFHWLATGSPTSNRTEFLDEARSLASRGVVSLLVDGTFPWKAPPATLAHDRAAVEADLAMVKAAHGVLLARPEVDPDRVAFVGHDFGAMYQSVAFGRDSSVAALVMMAPTARWADWFLRYWSVADNPDTYRSGMKPLDPITALAAVDGRPVLLQFAGNDRYVPADVAEEITTAAGSSAQRRTYDAGHELDEAAQSDRDAWLAETLGLRPEP